MSTISDALKKVQQQRAASSPERLAPPVVTTNSPVPPRSQRRCNDSESPMTPLVWRVVVIIALVLGVSVLIMRYGLSKGTNKNASMNVGEDSLSPVEVSGNEVAEAEGRNQSLAAANSDSRVVVVTNIVERSVPVPVPVGPEPKLVGIFYSEQNPVAIINGISMKKGEQVGGYVVSKILVESVVLKAGEHELVLRLR
jgi:hypothetical protein